MSGFVHRTKGDVVKNIVKVFAFRKAEYLRDVFSRDNIYLGMFSDKLFLERYGMLPDGVVKIFGEVTLLHLGKTVEQIEELTQKMATNNVLRFKNQELKYVLSKEELDVVTEYHKYLFANHFKNEEPFK